MLRGRLENEPPVRKKQKESFLTGLPEEERHNMYLSIREGRFAAVMNRVVGGAFLTGFALALGMEDYQIGFLAAIPAAANLAQLSGSYLVQKVGSAKTICLAGMALHRLVWLFILLLPFMPGVGSEFRVWSLIIGVGLAGFAAANRNVGWNVWMSEIIPENIRGRFFGRRNMSVEAVGMVVALGAGQFLDLWRKVVPDYESYGFSLLFGFGLMFGIFSWLTMRRISEKAAPRSGGKKSSFFRDLKVPLRDRNFRYLILFGIAWSFAVGTAGPFFNVYMIRTLKIPFSLIALFGLVSGLMHIVGLRFWGELIDRIGSRSLLFFASMGSAVMPLLWILSGRDNYSILWLIYFLSGLTGSAVGLSTSLLRMQLAVGRSRSTYFALFAAANGLSTAVAPIVGGVVSTLLIGFSLETRFITLSGFDFLFLTTSFLRMGALFILPQVKFADEISLRKIMRRGVQIIHPMRFVPQIGVYGYQALENLNVLANWGMLEFENQMGLLLGRGSRMLLVTGNRAGRLDIRLELGIILFEHYLNRGLHVIADRLVRIVNCLHRN